MSAALANRRIGWEAMNASTAGERAVVSSVSHRLRSTLSRSSVSEAGDAERRSAGSKSRQDELFGGLCRHELPGQQRPGLSQRHNQGQNLGDPGKGHREDGDLDVRDSCEGWKLGPLRDPRTSQLRAISGPPDVAMTGVRLRQARRQDFPRRTRFESRKRVGKTRVRRSRPRGPHDTAGRECTHSQATADQPNGKSRNISAQSVGR